MQQYDTYITALKNCGLQVKILDQDERFPDGHFVEDPVVIFHDMAFVCRSGAEARRGESETLLPHLDHLNIVTLHDDQAFIDGGDVLFCADRVLIGLSERTNRAGAEALAAALRQVQADILVECMSFEGVLHLKSGLTELAPGILVHDPTMQTDFPLGWAQVVTLPAEEGYAADVMPVNDTLFIVDGFPTVRHLAEQHYDHIIALDMSEFRKMDGGLTCLSLRY
jgi:dimethylargininase